MAVLELKPAGYLFASFFISSLFARRFGSVLIQTADASQMEKEPMVEMITAST